MRSEQEITEKLRSIEAELEFFPSDERRQVAVDTLRFVLKLDSEVTYIPRGFDAVSDPNRERDASIRNMSAEITR